MTYHTFFFFFFNDTATTEIYTLSLHDALPIYEIRESNRAGQKKRYTRQRDAAADQRSAVNVVQRSRSEEHTSELQSQSNLVCRLLLEKKKKTVSVKVCRRQRHPIMLPAA